MAAVIQALLERGLALEVGVLRELDEDDGAQAALGHARCDSRAIVRAITPSERRRRSRRAIADGESGTNSASASAVRASSRCTSFRSAMSKRSSIPTRLPNFGTPCTTYARMADVVCRKLARKRSKTHEFRRDKRE